MSGTTGGVTDNEPEVVVLCDSVGPFLRHVRFDLTGTPVAAVDTTLDGVTPYVVAGPVTVCADAGRDTEALVLCDNNGPFLRKLIYDAAGVFVSKVDTELDGTTPRVVVGTVTVCLSPAADAPILTGINRLTGDTPLTSLTAAFPGLQSVTVTVLAGVVNVTCSTGAAMAIPAGVSLTWSVNDTDDSSLAAWSHDGAAGSDYLLNWTYKPTAAG